CDAPRWPRRLSSPSTLMPFQTVGAHGVHQRKTELSNLFSLFSPFPPVECFSWLECKNLLPIIFHADDGATVLLRLVIKCLRKRADLGVGQFLSRTVRIFSLCVVVQHEHRQARTVASFCIFEHLLVAGRVAKGDVRAPADH